MDQGGRRISLHSRASENDRRPLADILTNVIMCNALVGRMQDFVTLILCCFLYRRKTLPSMIFGNRVLIACHLRQPLLFCPPHPHNCVGRIY
jgi:hypothetical protein